jgi:hypothetical protein
LSRIDEQFPVFVLCGVLFSHTSYHAYLSEIKELKNKYWPDKKVILHSRDIRKCQNEFSILLDTDVKAAFYNDLNRIIAESDYEIIAAAIHKPRYLKQYGLLSSDVYQISLSFVVERAIFCLDGKPAEEKRLSISIEKRGRKEDNALNAYFHRLLQIGTFYVNNKRMLDYDLSMAFKDKQQDISGLQLSDLVAYPIARYVLDPERANPAFDIVKQKFYKQGIKRYGLKVFP